MYLYIMYVMLCSVWMVHVYTLSCVPSKVEPACIGHLGTSIFGHHRQAAGHLYWISANGTSSMTSTERRLP